MGRILIGLWLLLGVGASVAGGQAAGRQPLEKEQAQAARQRYIKLVEAWAKDVAFTSDEAAAMEAGKQVQDLLKRGPDDPLAKQIMAAGEPSYAALEAAYPGKILDRTLLGTWSDPTQPLDEYPNEFHIYWNGAIAADLTQGRHNTVVEFLVGDDGAGGERFGRVRDNYDNLQYERGYLPIVTASYELEGIRYTQTAFAWQPKGQTKGWDVAFVALEAKNLAAERRRARIAARVTLMDEGEVNFERRRVIDARGGVLVVADENAIFEDDELVWRFELAPGESRRAICKMPYVPDDEQLTTAASEAEFDHFHTAAGKFWQELLDKGSKIETPEARVNDVWRTLMLQNFVIADGPRYTYGSGLMYNDATFPYENGFATHVFAMYGHGEYANALQDWFIHMSITPEGGGRKYQNRRGMVLHHLLENYRLTGRTDLFERYRDDYIRVAEEIVRDHHSTMVMENGEKPLHWGLLPPDKPGVDLVASTQTVYVLGHSITNAQGLANFGRFLVVSGIDPQRGERYLQEAANFRQCILDAMRGAAIRIPGRPPFVDLQTLYFRETPDYGPEPYDDLGYGRLQGLYYHYWVDMQLHYHFFNPDDEPAQWMTDYVQQMNGFVLGQCRGRTHPGEHGRINNVYDGGYYNFRLRQGEVDEFLLGLYSKLALGMSRYTYVAAEAVPFIGYNTVDGGFVAPQYSLPNSAANADWLLMLRNALVMEELRDNVETGTLQLMKGAPRAWLASGRAIRVERMHTFFGEISFVAQMVDNKFRITIDPPAGQWQQIELHLRHPIQNLTINGEKRDAGDAGDAAGGVILIPHQAGRIRIEAN